MTTEKPDPATRKKGGLIVMMIGVLGLVGLLWSGVPMMQLTTDGSAYEFGAAIDSPFLAYLFAFGFILFGTGLYIYFSRKQPT